MRLRPRAMMRLRWLVPALGLACGLDLADPPFRYPFAAATADCGPADAPAVSIHLARDASQRGRVRGRSDKRDGGVGDREFENRDVVRPLSVRPSPSDHNGACGEIVRALTAWRP
jgi:hypothetical protein